MRISILSALMAAIALSIASCGHSVCSRNLENVAKLREGMTQSEVRELMGVPLESESYHKPNVWYYYTERKWADGNVTSDECTPLVFDKDGRLLGWGAKFFKEYRTKDW